MDTVVDSCRCKLRGGGEFWTRSDGCYGGCRDRRGRRREKGNSGRVQRSHGALNTGSRAALMRELAASCRQTRYVRIPRRFYRMRITDFFSQCIARPSLGLCGNGRTQALDEDHHARVR